MATTSAANNSRMTIANHFHSRGYGRNSLILFGTRGERVSRAFNSYQSISPAAVPLISTHHPECRHGCYKSHYDHERHTGSHDTGYRQSSRIRG